MLDRNVRALFISALIAFAACGGDDDGSSDGGDDTGNDGGNGNGSDAGTDVCMPVTPPANDCTPVGGTNLALEPVAQGLDEPLFVTSPPGDSRLFIVEKPGAIRIVKDGQLLGAPFLEIYDQVAEQVAPNEQGLLGLAFHPGYAMNGRFYVFYTATSSPEGAGANVVAEYTVSDDPDVANAASERRILEVRDPFSNHNGGMMAFGPDCYLYVGMGDGGDGGDPHDHGQNRTTLLGDMLRIDVDGGDPYGIPSDNPLVGDGGGVREEIWLSGLRNPWRWSFDRATGEMYIADVGQGLIEEVSVVPAGQGGLDLGWDQMEGSDCFADPDEGTDPDTGDDCTPADHFGPIHTYPHDGNDGSITGGYVYRGSCFPDLAGWYFFADWDMGRVFKLEYSGGTANEVTDITSDLDPGGVLDGLASFGEDAYGEVYIVSLYGGTVHRIVVE